VFPLLAAACGTRSEQARVVPQQRTTTAVPTSPAVAKKATPAGCSSAVRPLGTSSRAYVGFAANGAVALRAPNGPAIARFGPKNDNDYPTFFGVLGVVKSRSCEPLWYRVELPIRPNGSTGFVRASSIALTRVNSRILVDVSDRRLTLYESGKVRLTDTVAVGSPATPTPVGRYYVNQRLVPTDASGPFGPAAVGISAFSDVLTGWAQGGPIAIHGTNEPWSIGRAASNGCIRLPNATLRTVFSVAVAGTPVVIRA
jgi:lipoprotein-anchoring transpeptidase ErfK/SrfK